MASEDLLKKAVAAFNALSPEQQAEMMEGQRQSWVRGNVGLSRDERGMTSPVMPRPAPVDANPLASNPVDDKIAPDNSGNAPAATDTGLVTVLPLEWRKYRNGDAEAVTPFGEIYTAYVNGYWRITRNGKAGKFIKATGGDDVEAAKAGAQADFEANVLPLVRSQAEELLAAERAKYRDAMEKLVESQRETLVWQQRAIDLKSDNAAKDK